MYQYGYIMFEFLFFNLLLYETAVNIVHRILFLFFNYLVIYLPNPLPWLLILSAPKGTPGEAWANVVARDIGTVTAPVIGSGSYMYWRSKEKVKKFRNNFLSESIKYINKRNGQGKERRI